MHSFINISDMAVQNCIGDAFRGATWVALHNGGGCGWYAILYILMYSRKSYFYIFLIFLKWRNTNLNHFRGEVINGGFGLVLDGSDDAAAKAESMLNWDVSNGVARRYSSLTFQ